MLNERVSLPKVLCFVGPTGSGKTSIATEIVKRSAGSVRRSVSATTRSARAGEIDGESYHFLSEEEFSRRVDQGLFYEWEWVHSTRYGTPCDEVERAEKAGVDLILTIDVKGALRVRAELPDRSRIVFLTPPSGETLLQRVRGRGDTSDADLKVRLQTAVDEYTALEGALLQGGVLDYIVVNDSFENAVQTVESIVVAERHQASRIRPEFLKLVTEARAFVSTKG